jgi:serine/threonine-protein kinase RsbW
MRAVDTDSEAGQLSRERVFQQVTLDDLVALRRFVRQTAVAAGFAGPALEELIVAVNEAASNIVRHGFQGQPADITVVVSCETDTVEVTLLDHGPAFDPDDAPRPDTSLPLAQRPFGGLGVQLMRDLCSGLAYRRDPDGRNELRLSKQMQPAK